MSATICLAPARTLAYPQGGGHLWVYLQWALALRALGHRVIWLEGIDARDPARDPRAMVAALESRLERHALADSLAAAARAMVVARYDLARLVATEIALLKRVAEAGQASPAAVRGALSD